MNIAQRLALKEGASKFHAMYFSEKYGAIFGNQDLVINFDNLKSSYSKLGSTYELGTGGIYNLAGRYNNWNIEEIEIFSLSIPQTLKSKYPTEQKGSSSGKKMRGSRGRSGFETLRRMGVNMTKAQNTSNVNSGTNAFSYSSGSPSFRGGGNMSLYS